MSRAIRWSRAVCAALVVLCALAASADEAAVRRLIEEKAGGAGGVESIRKTPWGDDLYEVVLHGPDGPIVYYVNGAASIIIAGQAIDAKSGRNLTRERMQELSRIEWKSLPFDSAITTVRGNGRRKIAVFSDPNCPYCKRFEKDLAKLDDITVHIFLYPVISPHSVRLTKSVWCAKDRAKAWHDLMLRDIEPSASPDCKTPIEKLVVLGRKLGANSTPTWFVETGERYQGAFKLEDLRQLLDKASPPAR